MQLDGAMPSGTKRCQVGRDEDAAGGRKQRLGDQGVVPIQDRCFVPGEEHEQDAAQ